MSQAVPAEAGEIIPAEALSTRPLIKQLLWLALPVLSEHVLHMLVGLTDTYLANHLHRYTSSDAVTAQRQLAESASAAAAVGTMAYILWFIGLFVSAIGTGATAIIARATGAKHRSLANSICGQSVTVAVILGLGLGGMFYLAHDACTARRSSTPIHTCGCSRSRCRSRRSCSSPTRVCAAPATRSRRQ
jgi:Na+-driven multidrug efflux pump